MHDALLLWLQKHMLLLIKSIRKQLPGMVQSFLVPLANRPAMLVPQYQPNTVMPHTGSEEGDGNSA